MRLETTEMVVVFPAPLGPRRPKISPSSISSEIPRTASRPAKLRWRSWMTTAGMAPRLVTRRGDRGRPSSGRRSPGRLAGLGTARREGSRRTLDLPHDQSGDAEGELPHAFGKRQCHRDAGGETEDSPEQHEAPFLDAERARDRKGDGADRLAQALDDQRARQFDRVAEKAEREPGLSGSEEPAEDVPAFGQGQGARMPVQTVDPCVHCAGVFRL